MGGHTGPLQQEPSKAAGPDMEDGQVKVHVDGEGHGFPSRLALKLEVVMLRPQLHLTG